MKLTDYNEAKRLFTDFFDLRLSDYYDIELSMSFQVIHIDILKFDGWLHEEHDDYEDAGYTMQSLVSEKYSPEAWLFLDNITTLQAG